MDHQAVAARPFRHPLRETDVVWTSKLEHSVQYADGNRNLGRATPIGAGS